MDTHCLKQLRLLEFALLHESGSRKAAGAVVWFSETTHIALAVRSCRTVEFNHCKQVPGLVSWIEMNTVINHLDPTLSRAEAIEEARLT
jgi:hypothetical protein